MSGLYNTPRFRQLLFRQWLSCLMELRVKPVLLSGLFSWCIALSVAQAQVVPHTATNDSLVKSLKQQILQATQDTTRVVLISKLAVRHSHLGESKKALSYLQQGLTLAKKTNDPHYLGHVYVRLGHYYNHQSMYAPGCAAYRKAIPLLQRAHRVPEATRVMYALAQLHTAHGYMLQAINQLTTNLAYCHQTNYYGDVVNNYALLYTIHIELNDRASAFADVKAVIEAAYQHHNPEDISLAHGNAADWYERQGDYSKALREWRLSLRAGLQLKNWFANLTTIYCGIADNLIKQNRLREAQPFIDNAFWCYAQDKQLHPDYAWLELARLRERQGRLEEAYQLSIRPLKYARGTYPSWTITVLETVYSIQKKQGNYKQALATYEEIRALTDSVQEVRKVRMIATIEAKLAVERQKKDIAILKKNAVQANLNLERTRQRQLIYVGLVMGLTLLVTLVGWFSWQARRKNRMLNQQQNEIMTQAEHLQELNTMKDRLFMMIGHDLRSPVMNLKNNLTKLTAEPLSAEQLTVQTDQLRRTTDTLYTTLDNLLHWAALQGDGVLTRQRLVELPPLVTDALALLEPAIAHKQLSLTVQDAHVVGWTDEYQAQIVIRNIVHNAIKFTPPGGQIRIHFEQSDEEAIVVIADTGVGMKTTDPVQAASLSNRRGTLGETGTGLGLQVCNELMSRNQGQLVIESTVGQGTTVRLIFSRKADGTEQPYELADLGQTTNATAC